ncbi:hypothetical protein KDL01_37755 [Actinospica durhamensis]|uniref:Uncharacterized protein n=1 Tax=Actinospica durhamensis TaxID=1508375 RepID=A0A941EYW7_9ACTN|nr:hypothetical protein [Actinospica durhamensis]MBR7839073.1 hypothetical protein [Actinospica durhamensis]
MLRLTWALSGDGWADCTVADQDAEARLETSHIASVPEDLLTAVARLLISETETRADFETEPAAFRWIFKREGDDVSIRLLQLPDRRSHDREGTELWTSRQPADTLARAVIRCFDNVVDTYGESGYHRAWRRSFPHFELEALRAARRNLRKTTTE